LYWYQNKTSMLLKSGMLVFAFMLSSCAATGVREVTIDPKLPRYSELKQTPFFPQQEYHCGPAALATALHAVDIRVSPDTLAPEVYIPSRKGSLQIEMLAAARRHGALAVKIAPDLGAVLKEIAVGNVVVVMQNLGLSWAPSWHYAVVVGYDLDKELMWLRSGTYERFEMSLSTFQRTWARSQYWAFVAMRPGSLPATAGLDSVIQALVAFEKNASVGDKTLAYTAAVKRWPDNLVLLMGLGNSAFMAGDLTAAASAFSTAIEKHPESAAAYNNYANVLLAQRKYREAKVAAEHGLQLAQKDAKLQAQIKATLDDISSASTH
jgi:tetratricopeptide (TPR) repeat protein